MGVHSKSQFEAHQKITALRRHVSRQNIAALAKYEREKGPLAAAVTRKGWTLLHIAAKDDKVAVVKFLLEPPGADEAGPGAAMRQ